MGDSLTLISDGLLSRWGFNDGDVPDAYLDWCDANEHPYPDDWNTVLRTLVRTRLVPALDQRVELTDIETAHNPIRAVRVEGQDVTGCWSDSTARLTLTPECVEIPYADVLAIYAGPAGQVAQMSESGA
jgi:hypothetical protein